MTNIHPESTLHGVRANTSTLTWLGVLVGACILAIHSFSGQALEDDRMTPANMAGETLSALHAAIPDRPGDEELPASF